MVQHSSINRARLSRPPPPHHRPPSCHPTCWAWMLKRSLAEAMAAGMAVGVCASDGQRSCAVGAQALSVLLREQKKMQQDADGQRWRSEAARDTGPAPALQVADRAPLFSSFYWELY